jgi:stage II sporulation protein D
VRRPLIACAVALAGLAASAATGSSAPVASAGSGPTADANAAFVLTGVGNGHGVGLSQYGAFAQARAGRTAAEILSFYFPGTELGRRAAPKLRVLLVASAPTLAISSPTPFTVRDAAGQSHHLPAGPVTLDPALQLSVDGVPTELAGPLTFTPTSGSFVSVGPRAYRGTIEVSSDGASLQAIDVVGLDAYLLGVVPGEMPPSWPAAALQAQAVAARSYALATMVKGKAWTLFPDGRSQQYLGVAAETPATTAAVKATAGSVLLYQGTVAIAFYSSSSGGRTQSGFDAFGVDVPYLPAQDDPWDADSPFHVWQPRAYTGRQLAKPLGLTGRVVDVQTRYSGSGRVVSITFTTADGTSVALAGTEARKRLALRSTAFRLATLRFTPVTAMAVNPRDALRLTGVARDAADASLERLAPDGTWLPVVSRLRVSPAGTFAAVVHPVQTTTYRLTAAGLPGPVLTISVAGTQP